MKVRTITELQNDDFLNQEELAKLLKKSVRTLQNWKNAISWSSRCLPMSRLVSNSLMDTYCVFEVIRH